MNTAFQSRQSVMEVVAQLDSRHRPGVIAHLLQLDADDRLNRFSALASDEYVRSYADGIAFARDIVLGAMRGSRVVGLAHGSVFIERGDLVVEIGVSVDAEDRRSGLGMRLMGAVMDRAKRCNVVRAYVLFRSGNIAMAALQRGLGARIVRDGNESSSVVELNGSAGVPVSARQVGGGADVLQVTHPREQGRALLVHGAGGDSYQWMAGVLPELFRAGYSVCAPTLPGHGRSGDRASFPLSGLLACVAANAEAFEPSVIVGHSLGGYLVQRHLESAPVARAVLLASLPPSVLVGDDLGHVKEELRCADGRAVLDSALCEARSVNVGAVSSIGLRVIGGTRDRVVPSAWVRYTARRYGVDVGFIEGGHRLMMGRAATAVVQAIAG